MSRFTKRKYVEDEVLNKYDLPTENQQIVKILRSCGNNLHEVCTAENEKFLVSMPTKFRKHIWVKREDNNVTRLFGILNLWDSEIMYSRGNFVIIEPIVEGVKVKGEIVRVLLKDKIKYFQDQGAWPKGFYDETEESTDKNDVNQQNDSDDEFFVNTNRPNVEYQSSSSASSSEEDEENEDEIEK